MQFQPAKRAEEHNKRQALLRIVRIRHFVGRQFEIVAARGERLSVPDRQQSGRLRPEVRTAGGHTARS